MADLTQIYKEGDTIDCYGHTVRVSRVYPDFLNGTVISDTDDKQPNTQWHKGGFPRVYGYEIKGFSDQESS